ncbi:MAG: oxaloacetate decarboxylase [Deltaproteobacteria bacterium]|nr:oxaloacetate decarboxylase [Deltaproteobacteria bacterium]
MLQSIHGPTHFRALLECGGLIIAPGVSDGLSARIAELAGFDVLYVSGGAIARGMGYADIGLVTQTEMVKRLEEIHAVTPVPLIVDADTGYGNALNVIRTVRAYERAGAAALHLEDQVEPKRCGHYEGKQIIKAHEMVQKIRAAIAARENPDFLLIARTDARAVAGLEEAIARGNAYAEAGADVIFVEAPQSLEEIERIAHAVRAPLLINMFWGGKTPLLPPAQLAELGYRIMIVPSDLQRAAIRAMQRAAAVLRQQGNTASIADEIASFAEREQVIGLAEVEELQRRFLSER